MLETRPLVPAGTLAPPVVMSIMSVLMTLMTVTGLSACYSTYQPGTLIPVTNGGTVTTTGCLDIMLEPVSDPAAAGPAAELQIGNRCDAAVTIDLTHIAASVRLEDGQVGRMQIFDPFGEIRPALLDGRSVAREVLEFHAIPGEIGNRLAHALCLDFRAIDRAEPSPRPVVSCIPLNTTAPVQDPMYFQPEPDGMPDAPAHAPAADPANDLPQDDLPVETMPGDPTGHTTMSEESPRLEPGERP